MKTFRACIDGSRFRSLFGPTLLLTFVGLLYLGTPSFPAAAPLTVAGAPEDAGFDSDQIDAAVQLFQERIDSDELRGAVLLVARQGKVVLHEAMGWRDKENGLPMEADTLFRLSSNTKPVVAMGALVLADEELLSFDGLLATLIPAFDRDGFDAITIGQLLSHSSGLPRSPIFLPGVDADSNLILEAERFADALELEHAPGTQYLYSNAAYNILGGAMEAASGQQLDEFLNAAVYEPLGMMDSTNHESVADHDRMAKVYAYNNGNWTTRWAPGDPPSYPIVRASGGMIATAWDYAVFLQTWLNGGTYGETRVVSQELISQASSVQSATGSYGFGWIVNTDGSLSHSGSDGTYAWLDPHREILGIVFTQSPGGNNPRTTFRQMVNAALSTDVTVINDVQTADVPGGVGSAWDFTGRRLVIGSGEGAAGALTIPAGASVPVEVLDIAQGSATATGHLTVDGQDAALLSTDGSSAFNIGLDGQGALLVTNGGQVTSRSTWIGVNSGSEGKVTLSGPGSRWDTPGGWHVRVGERGHGALEVLDGAVMENHASLFVGNGPQNAGGTGAVTIQGGSTVAGAASSRLGFHEGNSGSMTVAGQDSTFSTGTFFHVGSGGDGNLTVKDGGRVITGTVNPGNGAVTIGVDGTATGTVEVSGPGSLLDSSRWIYVGGAGAGTLLAEDGATVRSSIDFRLGRHAHGTGEVTFSGENTTLEAGSFVHVGSEGAGVMHVREGARVVAPNNGLVVGRFSGSDGTLNVAFGGRIDVGGDSYSGWEGNGAIAVTHGGRIETGGHLYIGHAADASGHILLSGADSRIDVGGDLRADLNGGAGPGGGSATLTLSDGGTLAVAQNAWARGNTSIELAGGMLIVESGTFHLLDNASLTGTGFVMGTLAVDPGATVQGSSSRIFVRALERGSVDTVTLGGVKIMASRGGVVLNNTAFAAIDGDPVIDIVLNGQADNLIRFDDRTDFRGTDVVVTFPSVPPEPDTTFALFHYTGPGEPDYNFASVVTPDGWVLDNGLLYYADEMSETPFEEWADAHGLTGPDADPDANPAGDGHSNIAKFAFGADPNAPVATLVDVARNDYGLVLRWNRSTTPGVEYTIETNSDLASGQWVPIASAEGVVMPVPDIEPPPGYERVEWSANPSDTGERTFYRVRAGLAEGVHP